MINDKFKKSGFNQKYRPEFDQPMAEKIKTRNSSEPKGACLISVRGDVQGVFYRHYTKKEAEKLGISGWVKNEHDGSVTIFIQGDLKKVDQLIEWAKIGTPMASVESVNIENAIYDKTQKEFVIK